MAATKRTSVTCDDCLLPAVGTLRTRGQRPLPDLPRGERRRAGSPAAATTRPSHGRSGNGRPRGLTHGANARNCLEAQPRGLRQRVPRVVSFPRDERPAASPRERHSLEAHRLRRPRGLRDPDRLLQPQAGRSQLRVLLGRDLAARPDPAVRRIGFAAGYLFDQLRDRRRRRRDVSPINRRGARPGERSPRRSAPASRS